MYKIEGCRMLRDIQCGLMWCVVMVSQNSVTTLVRISGILRYRVTLASYAGCHMTDCV